MAILPKKGVMVVCESVPVGSDYFSPGCEYMVEKVSKARNEIILYNDNGDLEPVDYPHDVVKGKFAEIS